MVPMTGARVRGASQALLPAVTSVSANLHGQFLLLAVRTVYNIFLNARDSISQTTARAALTQMVDTVFHRTMGFGDVRTPILVR